MLDMLGSLATAAGRCVMLMEIVMNFCLVMKESLLLLMFTFSMVEIVNNENVDVRALRK